MDAWYEEVAVAAATWIFVSTVILGATLGALVRNVSDLVEELRRATDTALDPIVGSMDYIAQCFEHAERRAAREGQSAPSRPVDEERFREQLAETLDEAREALSRDTIGQDIKDFL